MAAGGMVLLALVALAADLVPVYLHNHAFQRYVEETTRSVQNRTLPDEVLRVRLVQKAESLELPVKEGNVLISRPAGGLRIDVHYIVRVVLPFSGVDLHFKPGAASR
jgi:hypothetical protein